MNISLTPDGAHVVTVTAPTIEADTDWWDRVTRSGAWTVEHVTDHGLDVIRATRQVINLARARQLAHQVHGQVERSLDRSLFRDAA